MWLPTPEAAIARVVQRVEEGGHFIPADVVVRRYRSGARNMRQLYLPLADEASIYDNSDSGRVLVADREPGRDLMVHDAERWQMIERIAP